MHIIDGNFTTVSREATEPSNAVESHEKRIYKRQAIDVVAVWLECDPEDVSASEKGGHCYIDYPSPDKYGERLVMKGTSWWNVLRKVYADLLRIGAIKVRFWCKHHKREATALDDKGRPCCDSSLGGIMIPCECVPLADHKEGD
jgi:hypothetical protein